MCGRREGKRGSDNKTHCPACPGHKLLRIYEEGLGCCGHRREDHVGENWLGTEKKKLKEKKRKFWRAV